MVGCKKAGGRFEMERCCSVGILEADGEDGDDGEVGYVERFVEESRQRLIFKGTLHYTYIYKVCSDGTGHLTHVREHLGAGHHHTATPFRREDQNMKVSRRGNNR